jgi:hypothetical protein
VRVLAVDDGFAECGFALLEELGILTAGDGGGFEREHGAEGELTVLTVGAELMHGHGHDPVGGEKLVAATVALGLLLSIRDEGAPVEHKHPSAVVAHEHGDRCGGWFDAGARGGVAELCFDEGGWRSHTVHARVVYRCGSSL